MSRFRKYWVWTAAALVIVVGVFYVVSRTRTGCPMHLSVAQNQPVGADKGVPTRALPPAGAVPPPGALPQDVGVDTVALAAMGDKATLDDMIDMSWNSMRTDVLFKDGAAPVAQALAEVRWTGKELLDDQQADALRRTAAAVLAGYGTNDIPAYFQMLKESGETVGEMFGSTIRKDLAELGVPAGEIPSDPWEGRSLYWRKTGRQTLWQGLCKERSQVTIYETNTDVLPNPGKDSFWPLRESIITFAHIGVPPASLPDTIKSKGKVTLAEVTVFISHSDEKGGKVVPYVIRFWYDPDRKVWRPGAMACYPNRYEHWWNTPTF